MKKFNLEDGLIQISELKKKSEETFARIDKEKRPLAIISNGEEKAIVMSVKEYYRQLNQFEKLKEKLRQFEKFPDQLDYLLEENPQGCHDRKKEVSSDKNGHISKSSKNHEKDNHRNKNKEKIAHTGDD